MTAYGSDGDLRRPVPVYSGPSAIERLAVLGAQGLTAPLLRRVAEEAIAHAGQITDHHPLGSFGTALYQWFMAALRNELVEFEWSLARPDNLETVIDPMRTIMIAYSRGTSETGNPERTPATANEKGRATVAVVEVNQMRFEAPGWEHLVTEAEVPTYLALLWVDELTLEYRLELSLPYGIGDGHRVTRWAERIIIPSHDDSLDPTRRLVDEPDMGGGDLVVDVERLVS